MYQPNSFVDRTREVVGAGRSYFSGNRATPSQDVARPLTGRDQRLDMFRGLALVMIFINHVPGTIYENLTNRNFGFSDAAEAFVFMSGMAAGLAYTNGFLNGSLWVATTRVWARARQLYFVHLATTFMVLAIFAAAALWFDARQILTENNVHVLFQQPLGALIGLPTLTFQMGYLNILPLYVVMLLMTPAFIYVGLRQPLLLLAGSVLLWWAAAHFRLNFLNFPLPGGWFFNPFSWQILFVLGLLCGIAMKQGRQFVPYMPTLFGLAAAFVVFVLVWIKLPLVGDVCVAFMDWLERAGAPFYVIGFDKTFVTLPRMLHAFALFYMLASLPIIRRLADSSFVAPLRLLGRHGLVVFATGTVLSMALQAIKAPHVLGPLEDGLLLAIGLGLQLALAWALARTTQLKRDAAAARR